MHGSRELKKLLSLVAGQKENIVVNFDTLLRNDVGGMMMDLLTTSEGAETEYLAQKLALLLMMAYRCLAVSFS